MLPFSALWPLSKSQEMQFPWVLCEGLMESPGLSQSWNPRHGFHGSRKQPAGPRGDLGSLRGSPGHPNFQLLNHVLFLGLNSDTVLLCHLLRGKLGVLLDLSCPPAGMCYQTQGTGPVTPGSGDSLFIMCKPSHLHHQEAQLSCSVHLGQGRSFLIHLFASPRSVASLEWSQLCFQHYSWGCFLRQLLE